MTENSTEADVDAYLSNPQYYPVGMFDDSFDGNGNPMHNTPFFRQDLAAPFGSEGAIARLDNFNNLVFTGLFDQTNLTTPGGRAFLRKLDLNAYVVSLPAPKGVRGDGKMVSRGRDLFRTSGCTSCHNVDQGKPVPAGIVPMNTIFPGDNPIMLAQRMPPLNPVLDTPGVPFDDKMAIVNASLRGEIRGIALPLLLDLARKPVFLHDNSVPSLDNLFDPSRGAAVPHPFYLSDQRARADVIAFLRSLDTR